MYDWSPVSAANDRFWVLIRDGLRARNIAAPDTLTRGPGASDHWESPELLLSQTCGMPFRTRLHTRVQLVATPDYALPDTPSGYYYSELVVRADHAGVIADFAEKTLAFNSQDSQSGWAAPQNHLARLGLCFARTLHSGAHLESARAVVDGRADIAAIDAVTWRLLVAHAPRIAEGLRVIDHTEPTPGLPLITARHRDPAPIRHAVAAAIDALSPNDRNALGLVGLATISTTAYRAIPNPPPPQVEPGS
jgi:ABC-type phosphate/phosphonate transport system substrate-binding protein